ncbi:MAG: hypothetical protein MZV63_26625 [Marinilabiliales bacterium]|nr:hypothetical protein [Marinilabiliales bacterium]
MPPTVAATLLKSNRKRIIALTIVILLVAPIHTSLRISARQNPNKPGFNPDLLSYKDALRAACPDSSLVIAGNDNSPFIFILYS